MNNLKYCSILLLISFHSYLEAQINWTEDFNDNDLQHPIQWQGDTQSFITNANFQLQLNGNSAASPSFLGCSSKVIDRSSWTFYIKLDFSPSASNFAEVYLAADQLDPLSISEAYFLRIGGISGSADDVSLYVKQGNQETELIDGIDGLAGGARVEMMIKVEKDSNHFWSLWVDDTLNGNYQLQGSAYDSSIRESSYFILWSKYTSTRADKFYWDSISVVGFPFIDLEPIRVEGLSVKDSNWLALSLSEFPETNRALNPNNYRLLENGIRPLQITFNNLDSSELFLNFNGSFESGKHYLLEVGGLSDRFGNQMHVDSLSFVYYRFDRAYFGDVRITEIMADPSPSNGLPEVEYLEIFNTTNSYFNLNQWSIADPSRIADFSNQVLSPGQYLLLCEAEDTALLSGHGFIMGIEGFPTLNNSEDQLWLRDNDGTIIDQLNYKSSWHLNQLKRSGGWSLEMINPYLNCSGADNFSSSSNPVGGSPAKQNSIYNDLPDTEAPFIKSVEPISAYQLEVVFNETLDTSLWVNYSVLLDGENITDFVTLMDQARGLQIDLSMPLDSGKSYFLECIGFSDCEGNLADTLSSKLILPFIPRSGEIVLNEILFNPKSGGIDFVELLNPTQRVFSADGLWISNSVDTVSWKRVEAKGKLIHPNDLLVLSEELELLQSYHPDILEERHLEADLPSFPNESGDFYLWNQDQKLIEQFSYHEEMHFKLLSSYDGVSLERLDPSGESNSENFFSASAAANYATPSLENSQKIPSSSRARIGFREAIFSPDNDGFQDLLFLDYQFEKAGFVGTVEILDAKGRRMKKLVNNQLLSSRGSFRWDGIDDLGARVPLGIYILTFEAFHPAGDVVFKKLPFVVASMLD